MFPSSAVRVIQDSNSRLTIVQPPFFAAGIAVLLLVLVGAGVVYGMARATRAGSEVKWILLTSTIPFLCIAVAFLTARRVVVFDAVSQNVTLTRYLVGLRWKAMEVPLTQVSSATVVSGMGTHRLALTLNSGRSLSLGNYTSQAGYYEAANAINDFLKLHPAPVSSK
ncbi:MAG: hypothetical protein ACLP6G_13100 [Terriglobales bacterium]